MCIIAIKPAGKEMISDDIIENMFDYNSDGAGFMYPDLGAVRIRKGFMKLKEFKRALREIPNVKNKTVVMHFRIQTSGGITKQMTHPFPLSSKDVDLMATDILAPVGVAHNGVLPNHPRKGFSDTADFIKYQLVPLTNAIKSWRRSEDFRSIVTYATEGSRLAILTNDGSVMRIGDGWIEDNGYWYSNKSYKDRWFPHYGTYIYGDDDWDDYGNSNYDYYRWWLDNDDDDDWESASYDMVHIDPDRYCLEDGDGNIYQVDDCYMDEFNDLYRKVEGEYIPCDGFYVIDAVTLREVTFRQIKDREERKSA